MKPPISLHLCGLISISTLLWPFNSHALQTYRCDEGGRTVYSQQPCAQGGKEVNISDDARGEAQIRSALERQQKDHAYLQRQKTPGADHVQPPPRAADKQQASPKHTSKPANLHHRKRLNQDPRVFTAKVPKTAASAPKH